MTKQMKRLLTSCFGLGWLPIAPGTWGSLPPTIIFAIILFLNLSISTVSVVMAVIALAASIICVMFSLASIEAVGKKDPGEVVVDEVAGQAITFLIISLLASELATQNIITASIIGFLTFRLFDIIKPWPIKKLETFPDGYGILADDLLAGVYAGILSLVCLRSFALYLFTLNQGA